MEFYSLKKQLQEHAVRPAGSEKVRAFSQNLTSLFSGYESEVFEYSMPDSRAWSWGSLILMVLAGVACMSHKPFFAVLFVVLPSMLLLWEENGFPLWSKLFSFAKGTGVVLKRGEEPKVVLVVNLDSRPVGLFDRWDPEGKLRISILNAALVGLSLLAFGNFYFPWDYWQYAGVLLSIPPLLVLVDLIFQGVTKGYYSGALDNGSALLLCRMVSDLIGQPHWILLVDGGNVGGQWVSAFVRKYKPSKRVLFLGLERPGAGQVSLAGRHGLWTAVNVPRYLREGLQGAGVGPFVDYSYRRSLAALLSLRGYPALALVGHLDKENMPLLITDTVECIRDDNIEAAGTTVLRLVSLLEEPEDKGVD